VWTENINLALDVAPRLKAGVVWINCTNQFDAASGFGGYRESGFGREGGREGMYEYLKAEWETEGEGRGERDVSPRQPASAPVATSPFSPLPPLDRTYKLYIGGKQVRPDQGYAREIKSPTGRVLGQVAEGNRKDLRNAVEAAHAAAGWGRGAGHMRAQILYYIAENLAPRGEEFAERIAEMTGGGVEAARREVRASIERLFTYAAWADKWDGAVHHVPIRGVTLAMNEPIGVMGMVCPEEYPLLGFVALVAPAVAVGNTVVVVPSEAHPIAATEFYSVLETSDVPEGVINIVTGAKESLARTLAEHLDVDALWFFGSAAGARAVEEASAGNMKRTWTVTGRRDWLDPRQGEGREFLRRATEVKNVWIPYGE
jgi:aldehyde dehydrogenase (NAD+)